MSQTAWPIFEYDLATQYENVFQSLEQNCLRLYLWFLVNK